VGDLWYSVGGDKAVMRGRFISVQNEAGEELLLIGKSADGRPAQILILNELGDTDAALALGEIRLDNDANHAASGIIINERFSGDQKDVMRVTDHGWEAPEWSIPLVGRHLEYSTTSTSYVTAWQQYTRMLCRSMWVSWRLIPDTGQTISLRCQISLDDGATLIDVFETTVSSTTSYSFEQPLPVGVDVGDVGSIFFDVKVSGGTGSAYPRFGPYWMGGAYVGRSSV
jgi:hypothetical protein